jgi:cytochrome oxidase assembly protein ShyY1
MLLSPRVREGVHGVHVVTPLVRENGTTILVDRGFVSNEQLASAPLNQEKGEVEVLGMIRTSQPRNRFTPDNEPDNGKWYWTDVEAMSEHAGGEKAGVQPVFIEQIFGMSTLVYLVYVLTLQFQRDMLVRLLRGWRRGCPLDDRRLSTCAMPICPM